MVTPFLFAAVMFCYSRFFLQVAIINLHRLLVFIIIIGIANIAPQLPLFYIVTVTYTHCFGTTTIISSSYFHVFFLYRTTIITSQFSSLFFFPTYHFFLFLLQTHEKIGGGEDSSLFCVKLKFMTVNRTRQEKEREKIYLFFIPPFFAHFLLLPCSHTKRNAISQARPQRENFV